VRDFARRNEPHLPDHPAIREEIRGGSAKVPDEARALFDAASEKLTEFLAIAAVV
jgi:hypothetical protein